jgi:ketosteroid isomerase-like protein
MPEEPTTTDLEEKTRQAIEAGNRGDFDVALALYAPGAVWDLRAGWIVMEGREAIRDFLNDWIGSYNDWDQELEEFRDLGNDVSFAVLHQRGRLKGSSGLVELRYAAVTKWADGVMERITTYTDIDEARIAAERLADERE